MLQYQLFQVLRCPWVGVPGHIDPTRVGRYDGSSTNIDGSYDSYYARLLTNDYYDDGEYRIQVRTTCCNPLETSSKLRNRFVALWFFAEN